MAAINSQIDSKARYRTISSFHIPTIPSFSAKQLSITLRPRGGNHNMSRTAVFQNPCPIQDNHQCSNHSSHLHHPSLPLPNQIFPRYTPQSTHHIKYLHHIQIPFPPLLLQKPLILLNKSRHNHISIPIPILLKIPTLPTAESAVSVESQN